eukprot:TRINITY_DN44948_c0_g1_i2.p1 TRINITY_DN44948_c0_g1~~TRINITY_DN44948_c0_g1_i2.p1  ORF type:complete len:387 (+),score=77.55 TRINITY_DN44948_c0_g1_i2:178-1338(+)
MRGAGSLAVLLNVLAAIASPDLTRVLLSESVAASTGARCLDGTPAGYYIHQPSEPSSSFVFFLEGGGLCLTPFDCLKRSRTSLGSSKDWAPTMPGDNVYSTDPSVNPFTGFNLVFLPYCSGDVWTGTRTDKYLPLGRLYTAGHLVIEAVVNQVLNQTAAVDSVLFSGASAGGIGVMHNADWLRGYLDQLGHASAVLKAVPQAGFYFPQDVYNFQSYELLGKFAPPFDAIGSLYVQLLDGGFVDESCLAAEGHHPARCWDAAVLSKYVETPLFVAENQFDSNQLNSFLLCTKCSASSTEKVQTSFLADYGQKMRTVLLELATNSSSDASVFAPSCFEHTGSLCMRGGPVVKGASFNQSVSRWFFGGQKQVLVDECGVGMPCNKRCDC